jgi:hypothetical protein
VATTTPEILLLNSMTGSVVRQATTPSVITDLWFSHSVLLSGSSDGFLRTHDPRTGMTKEGGESLVKAHYGGVQGIQAGGNFLFTIGWGMRWMSLVITIQYLMSTAGSLDLSRIRWSRSMTYGQCDLSHLSRSRPVLPLSTFYRGDPRALRSPQIKVLSIL